MPSDICKRIRTHLTALVHNEIEDAHQLARLKKHIANCQACREEYNQLCQIHATLLQYNKSAQQRALQRMTQRLAEETVLNTASEDPANMSRESSAPSRPVNRKRLYALAGLAATLLLCLAIGYFPLKNVKIQVTTGQTVLQGAPNCVHVALTNSAGEPLSHQPVEVQLLSDDGKTASLATGVTTDACGVVSLPFQAPSQGQQYKLRVRIPDGDELITPPTLLRPPYQLVLTTDKPFYRPGQTLHARVLLTHALELCPLPNKKVTLALYSSAGAVCHSCELQTSLYGLISTNFKLPSESGHYTISAKIDSVEVRKSIDIQKYELPRFQVVVRPQRYYLVLGQPQELTGSVAAADLSGVPLAKARIKMGVTRQLLKVGDKKMALTNLLPSSEYLDQQGQYRFSIASREIEGQLQAGSATPGSFYLYTQVTHGDRSETVITPLRLARYPLVLKLVPESPYLVKGITNIAYLAVTTPDGQPQVVTLEVSGRGVITRKVVTNSQGFCQIEFRPHQTEQEIKVSLTKDERTWSRQFILQARSQEYSCLLRPDKAVYQAQEPINLSLLPAHTPGPFFLTVSRAGKVLWNQTIHFQEGRYRWMAPPYIHGDLELCLSRVAPGGALVEDVRRIYRQPSNALCINVQPDQASYQPGDQARIKFAVTGQDRQPRVATLALSVVDRAVSDLENMRANVQRWHTSVICASAQVQTPPHHLPSPLLQTANNAAVQQRSSQQAIYLFLIGLLLNIISVVLLGSALWFSLQSVEEGNHGLAGGNSSLAGIALLLLLGGLGVLLTQVVVLKRLQTCTDSAFYYQQGLWGLKLAGLLLFLHALLVLVTLQTQIRALVAATGRVLLGWITTRQALAVGALLLLGGVCLYHFLFQPGHLPSQKSKPLLSQDLVHTRSNTANDTDNEMVVNQKTTLEQPPSPSSPPSHPLPCREVQPSRYFANARTVTRRGIGHKRCAKQRFQVRMRQDFRETICWQEIITNAKGRATLDLPLGQRITTWRLQALGIDLCGALGRNQCLLPVTAMLWLQVPPPPVLSRDQTLKLAVTIGNHLVQPCQATLTVNCTQWAQPLHPSKATKIAPGQWQYKVRLSPGQMHNEELELRIQQAGQHVLQLGIRAGKWHDSLAVPVKVRPRHLVQRVINGYYRQQPCTHKIHLPAQALPGGATLKLRFYSKVRSFLLQGAQSIAESPYRNLEALLAITQARLWCYQLSTGQAEIRFSKQLLQQISTDLEQIQLFQAKGGGYTAFPEGPADPLLSADALRLLSNAEHLLPGLMKIPPTAKLRQWILQVLGQPATDSFTKAYLCWSWLQSLTHQAAPMRSHQARKIEPYLATGNSKNALQTALLAISWRLCGNQAEMAKCQQQLVRQAQISGTLAHWKGERGCQHPFRGPMADLETTALALYALAGTDKYQELQTKAENYLLKMRTAQGVWPTAQTTLLAIQALYARHPTKEQTSHSLKVHWQLDDKPLHSYELTQEQTSAQITQELTPAKHHQLTISAEEPFFYQVIISYYRSHPLAPPKIAPRLHLTVQYQKKCCQMQLQLSKQVQTPTVLTLWVALPPHVKPDCQDLQIKGVHCQVDVASARYRNHRVFLALRLHAKQAQAEVHLNLPLQTNTALVAHPLPAQARDYFEPSWQVRDYFEPSWQDNLADFADRDLALPK